MVSLLNRRHACHLPLSDYFGKSSVLQGTDWKEFASQMAPVGLSRAQVLQNNHNNQNEVCLYLPSCLTQSVISYNFKWLTFTSQCPLLSVSLTF